MALDLRGLIANNAILRLSGGVRQDPAVETWLTVIDRAAVDCTQVVCANASVRR